MHAQKVNKSVIVALVDLLSHALHHGRLDSDEIERAATISQHILLGSSPNHTTWVQSSGVDFKEHISSPQIDWRSFFLLFVAWRYLEFYSQHIDSCCTRQLRDGDLEHLSKANQQRIRDLCAQIQNGREHFNHLERDCTLLATDSGLLSFDNAKKHVNNFQGYAESLTELNRLSQRLGLR
jgi:hypothetical protein